MVDKWDLTVDVPAASLKVDVSGSRGTFAGVVFGDCGGVEGFSADEACWVAEVGEPCWLVGKEVRGSDSRGGDDWDRVEPLRESRPDGSRRDGDDACGSVWGVVDAPGAGKVGEPGRLMFMEISQRRLKWCG